MAMAIDEAVAVLHGEITAAQVASIWVEDAVYV